MGFVIALEHDPDPLNSCIVDIDELLQFVESPALAHHWTSEQCEFSARTCFAEVSTANILGTFQCFEQISNVADMLIGVELYACARELKPDSDSESASDDDVFGSSGTPYADNLELVFSDLEPLSVQDSEYVGNPYSGVLDTDVQHWGRVIRLLWQHCGSIKPAKYGQLYSPLL